MVPYTCRLELVRLPGRRRQHFVAAIAGDPFPRLDYEDMSKPPEIDWPEVKATLFERDRWLVWRAESTVCRQPGPFDHDSSGGWVPICKICMREARSAWDQAPAEARELVSKSA